MQTSAAISRCAISELHLKELLREMFRTPASGDAAQYAAAVNKVRGATHDVLRAPSMLASMGRHHRQAGFQRTPNC